MFGGETKHELHSSNGNPFNRGRMVSPLGPFVVRRWDALTIQGGMMLILVRKPGEQILIGDGIVITQFEDGRIGIEAPRSIKILRAELRPRKQPGDQTTTHA